MSRKADDPSLVVWTRAPQDETETEQTVTSNDNSTEASLLIIGDFGVEGLATEKKLGRERILGATSDYLDRLWRRITKKLNAGETVSSALPRSVNFPRSAPIFCTELTTVTIPDYLPGRTALCVGVHRRDYRRQNGREAPVGRYDRADQRKPVADPVFHLIAPGSTTLVLALLDSTSPSSGTLAHWRTCFCPGYRPRKRRRRVVLALSSAR